ncbi:MAG TPA: hypothetical protein VFH53_02595 [Phycisphaerae bacterium]|nr:hypothetical protein [Phycisphaerae bacterium]
MQRLPLINGETIHNWTQIYDHVFTGALAALPAYVRAEILAAHLRHHRQGTNANNEASALVIRFSKYLLI